MPDSPSQPHICPLSPSALLQPCLPQPPSPASSPHGGRVLERAGVGSLSPPHLLPTGSSSAASELGAWRLAFKAPQELAPNFLSKPFSHSASNIPFPLATLDSSYEKRKEKPLGLECKTTLKKIHVSIKLVILFFFFFSPRFPEMTSQLSPHSTYLTSFLHPHQSSQLDLAGRSTLPGGPETFTSTQSLCSS